MFCAMTKATDADRFIGLRDCELALRFSHAEIKTAKLKDFVFGFAACQLLYWGAFKKRMITAVPVTFNRILVLSTTPHVNVDSERRKLSKRKANPAQIILNPTVFMFIPPCKRCLKHRMRMMSVCHIYGCPGRKFHRAVRSLV